MTQSHLENCPFCGVPVELIEKSDKLGVIRCADTSPCMGSGLGIFIQLDRKDEAILAWNTRSTEARAEGLSSELECAGRNVARLQKHLGQEIALGERLVAALEKIELMDTDYTLGPDHNLEIARDIARDALTVYRSARP